MTTKRSVSPEATPTEHNKQPRTESSAIESELPASDQQPSTNGGTTVEGEEDATLPPVSDEAVPEENASEKDEEKEEEEPKVERAKGLKVQQLKNIKVMYEEGTTLVGWPQEEQEQVLYPYDEKLNEKVYIWKGDITTLEVDCIVNAANKSLLGGGGVDGAIHSAAGPSLRKECQKLHGADTGETKLTSGHRLPALHIAHTVGPIYSRIKKAECEKLLRSCYKGTLDLCVENGLKSVAFSGISTGIYGYPIEDAAKVACDEVRKFLQSEKGEKIDHIIFCNFRPVDVSSYVDNLPSYFPPPPSTSESPSKEETLNENSTTAMETDSTEQEQPEQSKSTEESVKETEGETAAAKENGKEGNEEEEKKQEGGNGKVPEGKASARKTGHQTHGASSAATA
ncbi:hypothetical protein JCM3765_000721 [Sporobolomyces pararoseus]